MTEAQITELTTAFAPSQFIDIFVDFAPWMVAVVTVFVVIGLIGWGVRKIRRKLSGGVA